jgi:hypothetical protein
MMVLMSVVMMIMVQMVLALASMAKAEILWMFRHSAFFTKPDKKAGGKKGADKPDTLINYSHVSALES